MTYIPKYTKRWILNLKKYASLQKSILSKVTKILENPEIHTREILKGKSGDRKIDITGLRSAEVREKYRIIFVLCEDCKKKQLKRQGIFFCENCEEENQEQIIKFLAFGSHDDAYLMK